MKKELILLKVKRYICMMVMSLALIPMFVMMLVSCSSDDYINAIPSNSKAVISVDVTQLATQNSKNKLSLGILKSLFAIGDINDCGIDVNSKIYLFESLEGNLALVAKVSDDDDLESWLNKLAKKGIGSKTQKRSKCCFSTIKDNWLVGFNSNVVVVMGPIITTQQALYQQQIIRYINQDEDEGLKASPIYERLDSIDAPIAIVAQVAALPNKFAAPFSLGAPKQTDPTQIYVSAGMRNCSKDCVSIEGETFSFNKGINESIGTSLKTLRPITQKYVGTMSSKDAIGAFLNANGKQLIELLHSNQSFMALLAGINTAIDMDNIIKSIDGDMAIIVPNYTETNMPIRMSAQLVSKDFLNDVPYWKQSCPKGGSISDVGRNFYQYKDGSLNYYFGVSDDMQYYSGGSEQQALQSIGIAEDQLQQSIKNVIVGKRLCMLFNLNTILGGNDDTKAILPILKTLLGGANIMIYSIK